ncbi:MAG: sugar-binding domain-containing protein [Planctomycetota bacterium]|jgi:beta-galactosidase/beta-glucuronidase
MDILAMVGVLVFVLAMLRASATGDAVRCLNGEWELQRTRSGDASELRGEWEQVTVPSHLRLTEERYAWYRRQFEVPSEWRGRHLLLAFGGAKFVSDVYVNGHPVGGHFGGWEPFELAVTDACEFDGPNEVLVRVKDVRGVIEGEPEEVPRPGAVGSTRADVLAPVGSRQGPFGIWQDVSLVARSDVYVEDVTVLTSVREGTLDARCALRNLGEAPREVTLRSKVLDGDDTSLELGSTSVTVPAGGTADVSLGKSWPDPKLWMPDSAHLYYLESAVTAEDGTELHVERTRFGFREVWIDGVHFFLNGQRMHFRYASGHPFAGRSRCASSSKRCGPATASPCACTPTSGQRNGTGLPTR